MKLAAQLWTVRDHLEDKSQVEHVLGRLRDTGYAAVEIAALPSSVADHFDRHLAAAGLVACAAHVPLEEMQRDASAVAQRCLRWGCGYAVIPSVPAPYRSRGGFERFGAEAVELAAALEPYRIRLVYHNHDFELEQWDGRTGLEILFASAPASALDAEPDTYWLQFAGVDPATWIRGLAGRVPLVHLKDMTLRAGRPQQKEVGEGDLDWTGILDACRDAGTEWLIVEQDECDDDPLECLAVSHRNLERMLDDID